MNRTNNSKFMCLPTVGRAAAAASLVCSLLIASCSAPQTNYSGTDDLFPSMGDENIDIDSYALNLKYRENDRSIVARALLQGRLTKSKVDKIELDLLGLTVDSVVVDGEESAFYRTSKDRYNASKLVITPKTHLSGTFTLDIRYRGVLRSMVGAGGSREGWMDTPHGFTTLNQPIGAMTFAPVNNLVSDKWLFTIHSALIRS